MANAAKVGSRNIGQYLLIDFSMSLFSRTYVLSVLPFAPHRGDVFLKKMAPTRKDRRQMILL